MQTMDWLWDFWHKENVFLENKEGLPIRYCRGPPPPSLSKENKGEASKIVMEKMGNGEWAKLGDLGNGTIMLILNMRENGDLYPRESAPLSISDKVLTMGVYTFAKGLVRVRLWLMTQSWSKEIESRRSGMTCGTLVKNFYFDQIKKNRRKALTLTKWRFGSACGGNMWRSRGWWSRLLDKGV